MAATTLSSITSNGKRLETTGKKPDIRLIKAEIEQALSDANWYYRRNENARNWWMARWPGQTIDGRKHAVMGEPDPFPWPGASDTRPRTVDKVIGQHITVAKYAFRKARIQAKAVRPFAQGQGEQSARTTQLLTWMIYTHMAGELRRELPLAWAWRFGYGASFMWVGWEQARRLEYHELSLPMLDELLQASGNDPMMLQLMEGIQDPKQEDAFATLIQRFSPVVTPGGARKIVKDLRELRTAQIPVAYVFKSKPCWRAMRPCVEVLIPNEASDIQAERWFDIREWVTETELKDRIETEDYDPKFVAEAIKHKGESDNLTWLQRTNQERTSFYSGASGRPWSSSYRDLIELHRFQYKSIENGVPCLWETVMSGNLKDDLYAKHGPAPYKHGLYPAETMRFEMLDRPILSSRGIPEIAYTWEQEIKAQRDGRTDRTSMINRPALIVPWTKQNAIKNTPLPGAVIGVVRPGEMQWMPIPPTDQTPTEIEMTVNAKVDEHFGLFGAEVDPDLKKVRREELAGDILGEVEGIAGQTLALMQDLLPDEDVTRVVGELARPFKVDRADIQGAYEISATVDIGMVDPEYAMKKLDMIGKALAYNTQGTGDMTIIFKAAMEIIDPDLAEEAVTSQQAATNKEILEEKQAFAQIMAGDEPALPMHSNYQLRLQTLQNIQQNNPRMPQRLAQNPDSQEILDNRIKFLQNQLQQQQNAQIGRIQTTQTFNKLAPATTTPGMAAA